MQNTYGYFYEKILEQLSKKSDIDDKLDILNTFRDNFVKRFTVLYMEATQPEEAYIIFETLNARGKDLEAADLLKNFLFSRVKNDVDNAQKRWMAMLDNLDGVDPTKFIRSFWNSAHPLTNEKALYRSISQQINNPKEGKQLLKDLEDYSTVYHDLMFPEETALFDNKDLIKHMKNLKTIGATTFYPVIIAMMARKNAFEEKEISDVLSVIEILYFRNSTICKQASNAIERFFAQLANNITNETFDTVDEICGEIRKQIVTDSVFEDAFKIWSGRSKEIIRYILYSIHLHLADDTTQVNPDTDKIHIEHIMPSKTTNWNIDENTHQDYLWRLGNLALMSGIANIKASNKPFSEKKAMYKNSVILPNPQVANNIEWGAKEIEERQEQLCKYALEIWKI